MNNPAFTKKAVRRATAQEFEAALVVLSQDLEARALVASLRKSAESLRGAADELRPHL